MDTILNFHQLHNLRSRTGVETLLYATRGTTDIPLQGFAFATEGVQNFVASVMGFDDQDFVTKMEGFAVQGMKGSYLIMIPIYTV